jgi:hypothetical protein
VRGDQLGGFTQEHPELRDTGRRDAEEFEGLFGAAGEAA